ncbi:hypothetical protein [Acetobacter indonesiensis]
MVRPETPQRHQASPLRQKLPGFCGSPAYSEQRSRLARSSGLGNNKSQEITELQQEKSEEDAIVTRLPEVKRGRKKKLG